MRHHSKKHYSKLPGSDEEAKSKTGTPLRQPKGNFLRLLKKVDKTD
jgi:hypothetical protein